MRVCVLAVFDYVKTVNPAFSAFMVEIHIDVVTRQSSAERDNGGIVTAVTAKLRHSSSHMKPTLALVLNFVMFNARVVLNDDFDYSVCKIFTLFQARVAFYHSSRTSTPCDNQHARE